MKKSHKYLKICRIALVLTFLAGSLTLSSCSKNSRKDNFIDSQRDLIAWMQKPATISDIKEIIRTQGPEYPRGINDYMIKHRIEVLKKYNLTMAQSDSLARALKEDKDYLKFLDSVKVIMPKIMQQFEELAPKNEPAPPATDSATGNNMQQQQPAVAPHRGQNPPSQPQQPATKSAKNK